MKNIFLNLKSIEVNIWKGESFQNATALLYLILLVRSSIAYCLKTIFELHKHHLLEMSVPMHFMHFDQAVIKSRFSYIHYRRTEVYKYCPLQYPEINVRHIKRKYILYRYRYVSLSIRLYLYVYVYDKHAAWSQKLRYPRQIWQKYWKLFAAHKIILKVSKSA